MSSAADKVQFGGDHYKRAGALQHWNMVVANGLGYFEAATTKYVTRWPDKGGILDLEKAGHYHDKLIEVAGLGLACPAQTHRRLLDTAMATGVGRGTMPRVNMDDYAVANNLGKLEARYCLLTVAWSDTANVDLLHEARAVLKHLDTWARANIPAWKPAGPSVRT